MSDDQVAMDTRGTVTVATYVDDHATWRRLAEAATPGPWVTSRNSWGSPMDVHAKHRDYMLPVALIGGDKTCGYYGHNAAYIAHSSPDRVLALLAELERLTSAYDDVQLQWHRETTAAEARIATLEAAIWAHRAARREATDTREGTESENTLWALVPEAPE